MATTQPTITIYFGRHQKDLFDWLTGEMDLTGYANRSAYIIAAIREKKEQPVQLERLVAALGKQAEYKLEIYDDDPAKPNEDNWPPGRPKPVVDDQFFTQDQFD